MANLYTGDVPLGGEIPWLGLGFFIYSFYFEYPHFLGFAGTDTCCCFSNRQLTFKPSRPLANTNNSYCVWNQTECLIVPVTTCMKCQHQCFCLDYRIAIPCDNDVPCLLNLLGLTVYYKPHLSFQGKFLLECFKTFDQLNEKVGYTPPPSSHTGPPAIQHQQPSHQPPYPVMADAQYHTTQYNSSSAQHSLQPNSEPTHIPPTHPPSESASNPSVPPLAPSPVEEKDVVLIEAVPVNHSQHPPTPSTHSHTHMEVEPSPHTPPPSSPFCLGPSDSDSSGCVIA